MSIFDEWISAASSGFSSLSDLIGGGFGQGLNFAIDSGVTVGNAVAGGAAVVLTSTSGGFAYAVDFAKTSATKTAQWSTSAAGDVRDFSIEAYEEIKAQVPELLELILNLVRASPPELGPYDPIARTVMMAMFSPAGVASWERDAVSKSYTMAFDFRGTATCTPFVANAFAGIYVDNTGQWGFFAHAGVGGTVALTPNVSLNIDLWMINGGRDAYSRQYFMPGLVAKIPLPEGGSFTIGGNALLSDTLDYRGFRATTGFSLIASDIPVAPDTGPSRSSLVSTTMTKRGPTYDAALRAARNPGAEGEIVATATRAALPFVAKPGAYYYIQCKSSKKFLGVPAASTADGAELVQLTWTGASSQRFRFDDAGENSFFIVPQHAPTKALDVREASTSPTARILQYQRHGGDNQRWELVLAKDGWYHLTARHSGQVLDVDHGSGADLAAILQYPWHGGDNQKFRFVEAIDQDKWRWCKRCSHLFYAGNTPSVCPAGGAHDPSASGAYLLSIVPLGYDGALTQDHWRWCRRCSVLSYGGGVGKCAAAGGAPHDTAGSANYVVRGAGTPVPFTTQDNWRWCNRCQGVFFGGVPGVCTAGGAHTAGTTNYTVRTG
ncbi:MAG: RICIN domain-containing protein [Nannocystaceae bacterium]